MTIEYVEILKDSRAFNLTRTSIEQKYVIKFLLPTQELDPDELEEPDFDAIKALFQGSTDDILALETAYSLIPLTRWVPNYYGVEILLVLDSINLSQDNNYDWWIAEASYKYDFNTGTGSDEGEGDPGDLTLPFVKIGFSIGNRTQHITQGLEIIDASSSSNPDMLRDVPDTGDAIGATDDSIEGTDVASGNLILQVTAYYYPDSIDLAFVNDIAELFQPFGRSPVNNAVCLGFAVGEVLLLGMSGATAVNEIIPITFDFDIRKNVVAYPDPDFNDSITMEGHDVLDYRYLKEFDDASQSVLRLPAFRFIHRVYDKKNLSVLGFPGA